VAKNDVTVTMSAQDAGFVTKWLAAQRAVQGVDTAFTKLGQSGQTAGRRAGNAFNRIGGEFQRAALAIVGVGSALQAVATFSRLLRSELELLKQRNREAGDFQVQYGTRLFAAGSALGPASGTSRTLTPQQLTAQISQIAKDTYTSRNVVGPAVEAGMLTGGAATDIESLGAVRASLMMRPDLRDDPDALQGLVAGTLEAQKRFRVTPEIAAANMAKFSLSAPTLDIKALTTKLLPAVSKMQGFSTSETGEVDTFNFLASLVSGMGQRNVDVHGNITGTGGVNLLKQLRDITLREGHRGTVESQLEFVTSRPEVRGRFLGAVGLADADIDELRDAGTGELTARAKNLVSMQEVFMEGSETRREMKIASEKLGNMVQVDADEIEAYNKVLTSQPEIAAMNVRRLSDIMAENQKAVVEGGVRGESARLVEGLSTVSGGSAIKNWLRNQAFSMTTTGATEAESLATAIGYVQDEMAGIIPPSPRRQFGFGGAPMRAQEPTPEQIERFELLSGDLNKLIELQKEISERPTRVVVVGDDTADESAPDRPPLEGMER